VVCNRKKPPSGINTAFLSLSCSEAGSNAKNRRFRLGENQKSAALRRIFLREANNGAAWRAQQRRRLTKPVFTLKEQA